MAERKSFAFRRMELMDKEHVPLDTQVGRKQYQARKNKTIDPVRVQVENNAGNAQKNAPENYMFQKKEW
jgi:hypothetical protein